MTSAEERGLLLRRLRDADEVLASLEMRQLTPEASALATAIKCVVDEGVTLDNMDDACVLLGRYRALTIGA